MKKILMSLVLVCILLSGCTKQTELVAYNVSIRDVTIIEMKAEEPYRGIQHHWLILNVANKEVKYETPYDLYYSIIRLRDTYSISNPGQPLVVDLIYNADTKLVTSIALSPKK
jgi:uncharacterized protein YebE (UPF0316 family)